VVRDLRRQRGRASRLGAVQEQDSPLQDSPLLTAGTVSSGQAAAGCGAGERTTWVIVAATAQRAAAPRNATR